MCSTQDSICFEKMYKMVRRNVLWFGCGRQQKHYAAAPPPAGVRRRMERNRQKLVGRDKGSLTEQQTEGTGTTTTQKKREYTKQNRTQGEPLSPPAA